MHLNDFFMIKEAARNKTRYASGYFDTDGRFIQPYPEVMPNGEIRNRKVGGGNAYMDVIQRNILCDHMAELDPIRKQRRSPSSPHGYLNDDEVDKWRPQYEKNYVNPALHGRPAPARKPGRNRVVAKTTAMPFSESLLSPQERMLAAFREGWNKNKKK